MIINIFVLLQKKHLLNKIFNLNLLLLFKNATLNNVIVVGLITFIISGFGFFKEIIIAKNYGLSELIDTYYIAILIPAFINNVFMSSYQSVFIPNYILELRDEKRLGSFQLTAILVTLVVSIFFFIIAYLFTDYFLEFFFKGNDASYYELIKKQFAIIAPCILFWGLTSIVNGILNVDNEFKFSTFSSVYTALSIIVCLLFFKSYLGDVVLAVGTLIGSILGFLSVLLVAIKRKIIFLGTPDFKSKNIVLMFRQLPAKLTASLLNGVNPIVDQYFSAQLIVGSIAALNYGIKIPSFAIGIGSIALGNVLLPYFSKMAVFNKDKLFDQLQHILKYTLYLSLAATIVGILISLPIVNIVFERGAFDSRDSEIVSKIQQMYLLQIPFYLIGIIMIRFLTAINKNNFMVVTSSISLILNIILNIIFMKLIGVYGLALSTSLVSLITAMILYFYIAKLKKSDV